MGCTYSTLSDLLRPGRKIYTKNPRKETILALGRTVSTRAYISHNGKQVCARSWSSSPEGTEAWFEEAVQILEVKQNGTLLQEEECEGNLARSTEENYRSHGSSSTREVKEGEREGNSTIATSSVLLETPQRICSEKERRLRCANLEVVPGRVNFDSDEEDDDFEFARVEEDNSPKSSFADRSSSMQIDIFSVRWEKMPVRNCCSMSEPEFEVLISSEPVEEISNSIAFRSRAVGSDYDALGHSDPTEDAFRTSSGVKRSNDLSSCLLLPSPLHRADSYGERESLQASPLSIVSECDGGDRFSANESVSDSLNESGVDGSLSPSPTSQWSFQSPDVRWDLGPSVQKWESSSQSTLMRAQSNHPFRLGSICGNTDYRDGLIPGLPDDLAQLCLMRVPCVKYDLTLRLVCKRWRMVLSSEEFFTARNALRIHELHISFVVHGNKVHIFNLQTHKWLCLPPLPREDGSISPDWGIDPYEWWQIDTVAVTNGTLFVIGGDKAEINSFTRPSKPTNRVHKYDFCQNRWIPVTPMQVARSHAAALSFGNWIFVAGGSEDREEGLSAEVYNFNENSWSFIANMNSSMRMCVGLEHGGKFYVKGENTGSGSLVEGEIYDVKRNKWRSMSPGMRTGLARGPIASANSILFVADWKDSQLKMYDFEEDSWKVVSRLPARISRLVGHDKNLYGLTGKIKVNPYNHNVISDAPAEVWRLDLGRGGCMTNQERHGKVHTNGEVSELYSCREDVGVSFGRGTGYWDGVLRGDMESVVDQQEGINPIERHDCSRIGDSGYVWDCLWRDPKQMVKTGGLAWVPCIAHCTLFED